MDENTRSDESVSVDEQRATWEEYRFTVCPNGFVNVENLSYGDESGDHIYSVEVSNGSATGCSCPHATYRDARCKHQIAVEQAPIVLSSASASASPTVRADGSGSDETDHSADPIGSEAPDMGRGPKGVDEL
jgi:hypothetical protein